MDYTRVLQQLCALTGPSGFEGPVARAAADLLRPWVDEVEVDRMGNVLGVRRCGRKGAPRLLLDAHLDEIGFLVTGHRDGFLRFVPLGGVDPRMLPDREITLLTDPPVLCPPMSRAGRRWTSPGPLTRSIWMWACPRRRRSAASL